MRFASITCLIACVGVVACGEGALATGKGVMPSIQQPSVNEGAGANRLLVASREARWAFPTSLGRPVMKDTPPWAERLVNERDALVPPRLGSSVTESTPQRPSSQPTCGASGCSLGTTRTAACSSPACSMHPARAHRHVFGRLRCTATVSSRSGSALSPSPVRGTRLRSTPPGCRGTAKLKAWRTSVSAA